MNGEATFKPTKVEFFQYDGTNVIQLKLWIKSKGLKYGNWFRYISGWLKYQGAYVDINSYIIQLPDDGLIVLTEESFNLLLYKT